MINQDFLNSCTDEQINKGVAWRIVEDKNISMRLSSEKYSFAASFVRSKCNRIFTVKSKYCSNPNDIMPIAFANLFGICPIFRNSDTYRVESRCGIYTFNTNPYRAICEVYILMSVNK